MNPDLTKYANKKICVALSGGRDSMALAHYLLTHGAEYGITLSALNCDHGIRGERSAADSAFVKDWCIKNGIPLMSFVRSPDCSSTENAARIWRLGCYAEAIRAGADSVATAHHLDDNAETVLFNLARGSGLAGMTGITDLNELRLIRPLISCSRAEIDEYISENNIPYVDDSTNFTDGYTRNKIRHNVLPELERAVSGAARSIYRFSRLAAEDEEYFDRLINRLSLITRTPFCAEISFCEERAVFKRAVIKALRALNGAVKDYTSEHAENLYKLQFAENGKKFEFLGFTAYKENGKIAISDNVLAGIYDNGMSFGYFISGNADLYGNCFIAITEEGDSDEQTQNNSDCRVPQNKKILRFDLDLIPASAVIRFMKQGDKFKKFGGGTKNLGDFFTDKKIPVRLRKQIPLIADGERILAVGGVEISDDIKVTDKTKRVGRILCADYKKF